MRKNLILAGLFALTFIVPENFNYKEFRSNAKDAGIVVSKIDNWPEQNADMKLENGRLVIRMYDSKLETPELKAILQALVNAAISPIVTAEGLEDAQWAIAIDDKKTLEERFNALLQMEKIRRGEE